jgi:hypothetical protein
MWELRDDYADKSRFRRYAQKHKPEYAACFRNLGRLRAVLEEGLTLQQCSFGFFRSEGMDVYRISQSGLPNSHETRLYIYAELVGTEIYLLTIGDKKTQPADIQWCHEVVQRIREQKEHEKESEAK